MGRNPQNLDKIYELTESPGYFYKLDCTGAWYYSLESRETPPERIQRWAAYGFGWFDTMNIQVKKGTLRLVHNGT